MRLNRSAGILLHPTSFPGPYGIGGLGKSAYDFLDFLKKSGQCLWQILPLGPTSFGDSPYQSFSTFAGNHLLIDPDALIEQGLLEQEDIEKTDFDPLKVDYGQVTPYKNLLFKKAFTRFISQKKPLPDFVKFCRENRVWLDDYALFMALREYFIQERKDMDSALQMWPAWPADLAQRKKTELAFWKNELQESITFQKFMQYIFFEQWNKLKSYANKLGISIIGDLPIFVSMDSADVWAHPELFDLDEDGYPSRVAGVPPDYFSETGQLWGNPLYNWKRHKETGYEWWIERIRHTLKMTDILRIDHFRGLDEYWAIPAGEQTAINGKWLKGPGRSLLDAVRKKLGDLPFIAEDLGIITHRVEALRNKLELPGMKVLQFAFESGPDGGYLPHNYDSPNAVVYTGTHDNNTSWGWYHSASAEQQDFFRRYLNVTGEDVSWDMIRLAYSSIAAYAIVPLQDAMGLGSDFRMNTPGSAIGNWKFRYTEEMLTDTVAYGLNYLAKLYNRMPV